MRIIGYERVSTARQGASGLGIEAQRQAIDGFVARKTGALIGFAAEAGAVIAGADRLPLRRYAAALGLALCRRLARAMGGDLALEPEEENGAGGARFVLRLRR